MSGNPGGRTKGIEALARAYADKAIDVLANALDDPDPRVAVTAAVHLLDRAYGKPKQPLAGDPDNPLQWVVRIPVEAATFSEWLQRYAPPHIRDAHTVAKETIDGQAVEREPQEPAK